MQIVSEELDDIKIVYKRIEDWRDLQQAEGVALDKIGQDLLQFRGEVNDEVYRVLIASRIARDKATGTYNNMIEVLSLALNVDPTEIVIEEGIAGEPQTITLIQIPLGTLIQIGMTIGQLGKIVAKLTAAGIGVKYIEFYGTFRYGPDTLIQDSETGYGDVDMTTGGRLGDLYQPSSDPDFPL